MIDHEAATPLYVQVADAVEERIKVGRLLPDRLVPSEKQLAQEYGVARGTARKALQTLRLRGLVITVVGRGTFVTPKSPRRTTV